MSILKFELTEKHITLVRNVDWQTLQDMDEETMHEEFGVILYGKPETEFDPMSSDSPEYTEEQIAEMNLLHAELPTALQIMLATGDFFAGNYKTKHHDINWVKVG